MEIMEPILNRHDSVVIALSFVAFYLAGVLLFNGIVVIVKWFQGKVKDQPSRGSILDLTDIKFLTEENIIEILRIRHVEETHGRQLRIIPGDGQPAQKLRTTGIDQLIPFVTAEEAKEMVEEWSRRDSA